jgi:hypothetical protein
MLGIGLLEIAAVVFVVAAIAAVWWYVSSGRDPDQ